MRRALRLAARGRGRVSPNPLVGAVIAKSQRVLGEGAHRQLGGAHAEAEAIASAGAGCRGATLYVTLEPCAHHGRTPPCADAVIAAGIHRVVCPLADPDARVAGAGFDKLRDAGVGVEVGILTAEAERLNAAYLAHRRRGRPWVILKLGQSLDGRIATRTGASRWITGEASRRHAHRWRSWVDGILVGAGTVSADDPELTVRLVKGRDPRPIVVDGNLRVDPGAAVFRRGTAILVTAESSQRSRRRLFEEAGTDVLVLPDVAGRIDLGALLSHLGSLNMTSVLLEGGRDLVAAALRARLVDEVMFYVAPRLIGDGISAIGDLGISELEETLDLADVQTRRLGNDLLITGRVDYPCSRD